MTRRREIAAYCGFGLITIVVGLFTYLGVFAVAEYMLRVPMDDKTTPAYTITYITAQVLQGLVAVLVTFYTNRKWVFTEADHSKGSLWKQLTLFASSRVVTFVLDVVATYGVIHLLSLWLTPNNTPVLLGFKLDAELWAKVIVSVVVIAINYLVSKCLVFKKRTSQSNHP